jgi:GrpB-like predicted nucleotidyltransferase (UPF0157 family)/predicted house-cleaning noncanonical NTP pyrophosphatase (MazG superfamily)
MKPLRFLCNKLGRDKTESRTITQKGKANCRPLEGKYLDQELRKKLIEESREVALANDRDELLKELADVHEVLQSFMKYHSITAEEVEQVRLERSGERGGFADGIYYESVEPSEGTWLHDYLTQNASQYIPLPEVILPLELECNKHNPENLIKTITLIAPHTRGNISHIGTTSLDDYPARKVIDLLIEIPNFIYIDEHYFALYKAGITSYGAHGVQNRRYLVAHDDEGNITAQIFCFESGDPSIRSFTKFTEQLKSSPQLQNEYKALRNKLINEGSYENYQKEKVFFIEQVLQKM